MTSGGSDGKKGGFAAPSGVPPYHVIATDMDGTLLNASHEITPYTKSVLQRVVSKYPPYEVSVVLASGRPHVDVAVHLASLDLPDNSGYIVSSNGARVHRMIRRDTGGQSVDGGAPSCVELEQIYAATMDPEDVYYLLGLLPCDNNEKEEEIAINIYKGDGWMCSLDWTSELVYFEKSNLRYTLFNARELRESYMNWKNNSALSDSSSCSMPCNPLAEVSKVYFGSDNVERLMELRARVSKERPHLAAVSSSSYCLEFGAEGVTKASGMAALVSYLFDRRQKSLDGAEAEEGKESNGKGSARRDVEKNEVSPWTLACCIAFGDGENDEDMLLRVGKGCVMGNAHSLVKSHLPELEVVGTNTQEGVGRKVNEVFGLGLSTK